MGVIERVDYLNVNIKAHYIIECLLELVDKSCLDKLLFKAGNGENNFFFVKAYKLNIFKPYVIYGFRNKGTTFVFYHFPQLIK